MCIQLLQSFPTLCDPTCCNSPGFSVHGIFPAGILEWVAMLSSRGSPWPRNQTGISCTSPALQADYLPMRHQRSPLNTIQYIFLLFFQSEPKLQYFGHLTQSPTHWKRPMMLGKNEARKRRGWQKMRWLDGITDSIDMRLNELRERVKDRKPGILQSMRSQRIGHDRATEQQKQQFYHIVMWSDLL